MAAADPLNLAGIVVPGERPAAIPGKTVTFAAGGLLPEPWQLEEPGIVSPGLLI